VAADIAAGCTKPGSVVTAAAAAEPDADLTANAATEQDADLAANAAAEHLCRQASRLVLRLSLSGPFLLRFGVTPAAATADAAANAAAADAAADAAAAGAAADAAAGGIVLQCRLTSTLPPTVF
jgi:hypothetical protein